MPSNDHILHPQPQMTRPRWTDLGGLWGFAYDDDGRGLGERWQDQADIFARAIRVPFPPESPASGIADTGFHPIVWYRTTFTVDPDDTTGALLLHCGAVDYRAHVWVDGQLVATHPSVMTSGYASNTTVASVQTNIASVGYAGTTGGGTGVPIAYPAAGKCLDVYGNDIGANGAAVDIWDCLHDAVDQRWTPTNGLVTGPLRSLGRCLDIIGGGTSPGTKVQLYFCRCCAPGSVDWTWETERFPSCSEHPRGVPAHPPVTNTSPHSQSNLEADGGRRVCQNGSIPWL